MIPAQLAYDTKTKRLITVGAESLPWQITWSAMSSRQRMAVIDALLPRTRELANYINGSTTNMVMALKHGVNLMASGGVALNIQALRLLMINCERERVWRTP